MAIQDHYLAEDLDQLNEELLKIHNLSVSAIKDAHLHNKKVMREENMILNSVYNFRG